MEQVQRQAHELKKRIPAWLYPSTLEAMDTMLSKDNCKTRSEFIEKAVQFYAGYLSGEAATAYLPVALVAALQGTVQNSESRTARLLFKLAVELDMMMNVLAAGIQVSSKDLETLRTQCIQDVKRTSGAITFKDAVEYQKGES